MYGVQMPKCQNENWLKSLIKNIERRTEPLNAVHQEQYFQFKVNDRPTQAVLCIRTLMVNHYECAFLSRVSSVCLQFFRSILLLLGMFFLCNFIICALSYVEFFLIVFCKFFFVILLPIFFDSFYRWIDGSLTKCRNTNKMLGLLHNEKEDKC